MIIKHIVQLDLAIPGSSPIIHLTQGDSGTHQIQCRLTNNRISWMPPDDFSVLIRYSNAFGSGGAYDTLPDGNAAWQRENEGICITLVPEMAALPGSVHTVLTFHVGGQVVSAQHLMLMVAPMAVSGSPVLTDYYNITGFLPAPDSAKEGQFLTAETVNDQGKITSVAAVDAPASGGGTDPGLMPTATVEETSAGATITLTDKNGSTTATVLHGKDGVSPTVQSELFAETSITINGITESISGTKLTISDAAGQQEVTIFDGRTAYQYAQAGGYTGSEAEFAAKMAAEYQPQGDYLLRTELPGKLPNPHAITVNGTAYDGSQAVELNLTAESVGALPDTTQIPPAYTHPASHSASMITGLAAVATSGSYADLSGTPQIPTIPTALKNPNALTVNGTTYDGSEAVDLTETINAMVDAKLVPDTQTELVLSDNLFDKSVAVSGQGFYHSSSGTQIISAADDYYAYVALQGAGTYRTKVDVSHHSESYAQRVPLLKEDHTWIQNITGTITDTGDRSAWDLEFTVTQAMVDSGAAIYPLTIHKNHINRVMMVKDRDYPSEYIPYGYIEVEVESGGDDGTDNILRGKTAVFLGDSICAGTTVGDTAPEYGWGWAGLIGEANGMTWKNYGRNGGTITPISSVDQARWVPTQADLALADYPQADYVLFEGGANDADTLKADGLGSFSESGYTPAGDGDFTGAFETLVLKLLTAFPNAKVGYIVAQKMGATEDHGSTNNCRVFFDRATAVCEKWGIPVLDLWKCSPLNPSLSTASRFYTDGQHLTLEGYQKITPQIEAFMRSL